MNPSHDVLDGKDIEPVSCNANISMKCFIDATGGLVYSWKEPN